MELNPDDKQWRTLTGLDFDSVRNRMRAALPEEGYKEHPTSPWLTVINPMYLVEALNDLFGPCGVGWGMDYAPDAMHLSSEELVSSKGRAYTSWTALLDKAEFWYAYVTEDGAGRASIPATGASDNEDCGYAVRGALTSALGGAAKWLEWQWDVYAGNHDQEPSRRDARGERDPAEFVIKGGQHDGKTLAQLAADDFGYLNWMASGADNPYWKRNAQAYLAKYGPTEPVTREDAAKTGGQKPPADKPGLYVLQYGRKHKGKTLTQIEGEDPGYLTKLIEESSAGDDVKAAVQAFLDTLGKQPAKGNGPHWAESQVNTRSFFAQTTRDPEKRGMGLTNAEVHEVLVGDPEGHLSDYPGSMGDALVVCRAHAVELGRIKR